MSQGQVFRWPYCLRARFFAGPTVAGPGFLLALLLQGQVFHWPYCLRARFFAGPTASGPGFLLALIHPWRADNFIILMYVAGPGFLLALLSQGQVFCWPYCCRARFFAGPTVPGPGFSLALLPQGQVFCWH